jgi:predicted nuclease of predicted toxin-antitoxin system
MKILIDMNLTPIWVTFFQENNINAVHWTEIGKVNASDKEIFDYAIENHYIIFTNDLDFGAILANSHTQTPSVIQVRTQDLMPHSLGNTILELLSQFEQSLIEGALITLDKQKMRVRVLPL